MPRTLNRPRQILFVGQRNDAVSQMAEAFASALLAPRGVLVASAGLTPTQVSPWAVRVMAEIGLDIGPQVTKSVEAFDPTAIDTLVLVEDGLAIPGVFRLLRRVEWRLDAAAATPRPPDARLELQRQLRDRVETLVLQLIAAGAVGRRRHAISAQAVIERLGAPPGRQRHSASWRHRSHLCQFARALRLGAGSKASTTARKWPVASSRSTTCQQRSATLAEWRSIAA